MTSVAALGDSDTRLKWAVRVAVAICADVPGAAPPVPISVGPSAPTPKQLSSIGLEVDVEHLDDDEWGDRLAEFDVVVVCSLMFRLNGVLERVREVERAGRRRPLVVTGYAGVVYEGHEMGALWRSGADVVVCNSRRDHRRFGEVYDEFGLDPAVLVRGGLGVLPRDRPPAEVLATAAAPSPERDGPIVFAVQPDVPRSREERLALLRRWVEYADRWPDRQVVVKLRSRPGEQTTHPEPHHYETLAGTHLAEVPANLEFRYGVMEGVLDGARALATVSSTAAMEALAMGVPTVILADFGVQDRYGTRFFLRSGLMRTVEQVIDDDIGSPRPEWLADNGFHPDDTLDHVARRVAELLDADPPPPPRFFEERRTPFMIDQARERLGAAGAPPTARHRVRSLLNGPLRQLYLRVDGWLRR
ncbi:DUF6716 putative glycosyltransferase [Ilumatobacter sp.]|uniref:DUF6716 putative glycosyltransferase n=1 Tax=Ilumatobacter sp. TaxID=1967498 RepID=UPI003B51C112